MENEYNSEEMFAVGDRAPWTNRRLPEDTRHGIVLIRVSHVVYPLMNRMRPYIRG